MAAKIVLSALNDIKDDSTKLNVLFKLEPLITELSGTQLLEITKLFALNYKYDVIKHLIKKKPISITFKELCMLINNFTDQNNAFIICELLGHKIKIKITDAQIFLEGIKELESYKYVMTRIICTSGIVDAKFSEEDIKQLSLLFEDKSEYVTICHHLMIDPVLMEKYAPTDDYKQKLAEKLQIVQLLEHTKHIFNNHVGKYKYPQDKCEKINELFNSFFKEFEVFSR
jgi:hypothetical protein